MNTDLRENIKIALLAIIGISVAYIAFVKKETKPRLADIQESNQSSTSSFTNVQRGEGDNPLSLELDPNKKESSVSSFPATTIAWAKDVHNFGKIKQHTENSYKFKFTNTGNNPLIIEDAQGSCGCTVPQYPKEPIPPGGEGEITVNYSPGTQIGEQSKTVSITANTEPRVMTLYINAQVEEAPDPAATK
jgi:hypothetical protein